LFFRVAKAFDPRAKDKLMMRLNPNEKALLQEQIRSDLNRLLFSEGMK
jgi:hypothetical protein